MDVGIGIIAGLGILLAFIAGTWAVNKWNKWKNRGSSKSTA